MNLLATAPAWLVAILLLLLLLAAIEDGWRLQISDWTSGAIALAAFLAIGLNGPIVGLWQNFLLFVVVLVIGTAMFARGWRGGGDHLRALLLRLHERESLAPALRQIVLGHACDDELAFFRLRVDG